MFAKTDAIDDDEAKTNLERQITQASNSNAKWHQLGPVTDGQGEPTKDGVGDREVVEIVGDRFLDKMGNTVHGYD